MFLQPYFYDPLSQAQRMKKDLSSFFFPSFKGNTKPAMNIFQGDDNILIEVDVPGFSLENIDLSLKENILHIRGDRQKDLCEDNYKIHRQERILGSFHRSVRIPWKADSNQIKALCKNGVLSIHIPRAEEDKPKKILIQNV